ncbi:protein-L-isoaspartate(D-aspartate) O-methyltransferase [Pontibacter cellulosilyticus]|uniref:Protein-L-isoaspartate O-methyltransferase n=1 Tax=Pontibacter cellulosilyticus TaxID=1720253 RepID=A0A923N6Q6_9BACT|nr:protein-L-isoaspartate(D-aspartate) O-methyltransferase [Pontibacter cellulosilyticus]MBC5991922.1 protein-L-isoaspartate(D-aspartate) O-methyltransferase [Pontibacter cellulosilyticus]
MRTTKEEMMEKHLVARGITDQRVLQAMWEVDRVLFVPVEVADHVYEDRALPIGRKQTISQPYMVAYMAQALRLHPDDMVLEIGTGCGYNAAILSRLARHIYSVEVIEWLAHVARENLDMAGIRNVTTRCGDGYAGWPEAAPFDAIILTASPPALPEPLKYQLTIGGRLIAPIRRENQKLIRIVRTGRDMFEERQLMPVQFVPMTGEAQKRS